MHSNQKQILMNKIKTFFLYSLLAGFALTSCGDDEPKPKNDGQDDDNVVVKSGVISSDETWSSENIYRLDGRVTVNGGAELTIEPGTVIKANPGTGAFASALLISREGKINAAGTESEPIIFTSVSDDIQPGEINSPNMEPTNSGLWGGVIILGEAPISVSGGAEELQIEGIPTSDQNGLYGGTNPSHSSGVFKYVSIRHGGSNIGSGNEINGLTMGGVGSGTEINHIEVVANQDDGLEWFGGDVSVSDILVWNSGDDPLDTDQDWTGTADNFIVVNPNDRAFEMDGPEGPQDRDPNHSITNGTVYMGDGQELMNFDDNTDADVSNIYYYGIKPGQFVGGYGGNTEGSITNIEVTLPAGVSVADIFPDGPSSEVTVVNELENTVGLKSASGFGWTWASQSGALTELGL